MPKAWSAMRGRQYAHIKHGLIERGEGESLAEEIAARVVNKERAQHGESKEASVSSVKDMSSGRRGGLRSHRGAGGRTLLPPAPGGPSAVKGVDLPLPHERDQALGQVAGVPDPVMRQARRDLEAGLVDTDMRAMPGLDAERRRQLVPTPPPSLSSGPTPTAKTRGGRRRSARPPDEI
jgi:hypothetical protein